MRMSNIIFLLAMTYTCQVTKQFELNVDVNDENLKGANFYTVFKNVSCAKLIQHR